MRRPPQRGDLAAGIDRVDASTGSGIPEMDVAIVATAAGSKEVVGPGAPRQSLDGSGMVGLLKLGSIETAGIPDADEVVIAASSELVAIGAPFKTTDFAGVTVQGGNLVLCDTHIVVVDQTIASTRCENVLVPAFCLLAEILHQARQYSPMTLTRYSCPNMLRTLA